MNVAVFVSGGGSNLQAILDRKASGQLTEANLCLVLASRTGTKAEERARQAGIDFAIISRKNYLTQDDYDQAMIDLLEPYAIDLIVLAGFLTKLGTRLIERYRAKIINVHPSLLPAFGGDGFYGIKPHEAVLAAGLKETGATVHLVTEVYDDGPILCQKRVTVESGDTAKTLQERVMREAEHLILPHVIGLITNGLLDCSAILDEQPSAAISARLPDEAMKE